MEFRIEEQQSLLQHSFSRNGVTKTVHVVAKKSPFNIKVYSNLNLKENPIGAKLYYDFTHSKTSPKEVETLKVSPLQYSCLVDNQNNHTATIEFRVPVLSSQHEGSLFRIKLSLQNSTTNQVKEIWSDPIRVISKKSAARPPEIKKERLPRSAGSPHLATESADHTNDSILQFLQHMEEQQRKQKELLEEIYQNTKPSESTDNELEDSLKKFLHAYQKIEIEERPRKLRKVMASFDFHEKQALTDFISCNSGHSIFPPYIKTEDSGYFSDEKQEFEDFYSQILVDSPTSDNPNNV